MTVAGWPVEMTHTEYKLPRVLPLQAGRMLGDDPALTTHILNERGTDTACVDWLTCEPSRCFLRTAVFHATVRTNEYEHHRPRKTYIR